MGIFTTLKKKYNECFDSNGALKRDELLNGKDGDNGGIITLQYEGEERLSMIEDIYNLIFQSNYMNELSISYIRSGYKTYDEIIEDYRRVHPELNINIHTYKSRMIKCQQETAKIFKSIMIGNKSYDIILWLLEDKMFMGWEDNEEKRYAHEEFYRQYNKFKGNDTRIPGLNKGELLIKLPKCQVIKSMAPERYESVLNIIEPYSKHRLGIMQNLLNDMIEEVGYLRYLLNPRYTDEFSDIDKERRSDLLRWLGKDTTDIESELLEDKESEIKTNEADNDSSKPIKDIGEVF